MKPLMILAKRFIAGETPEDAIRAVKELNSKGIKATLDVLGEAVKSREEALKAAESYVSLLDMIEKEKVDSNVSLKLTQMGLDIDYDFCKENLERILKKANEHGNFLRIDMEGSPHTQRTLGMFYDLRKSFDNTGIVIQSYLHRSRKDIERIISEGHKVRLCKGAYKEKQQVAFTDKFTVNRNYSDLMEMLLLKGNYPAIATHDESIIKAAKKFVENNKIPYSSFEFQMLYGIRRDLQRQLADEGYNMRVYVPFGTYWLPYTVRRLRERKENVFFVLKNLLKP